MQAAVRDAVVLAIGDLLNLCDTHLPEPVATWAWTVLAEVQDWRFLSVARWRAYVDGVSGS